MTLRNECAERESRLNEVAPDLDALLCGGGEPPPIYSVADIAVRREMVPMRDGVRLATDVYRPTTGSAPAILIRTPYNKDPMAGQGEDPHGVGRGDAQDVTAGAAGRGAPQGAVGSEDEPADMLAGA